jgi:hypothetical protein
LELDGPGDDADGSGSSPSWNLQARLAEVLGLQWQREGIDYARPGWYPSDMAIDELGRAVEARGGDLGAIEEVLAGSGLRGLGVRLLLAVLRGADALTDGAARQAFKRALVEALAREDDGHRRGADPVEEATWRAIVEDRNAVVVEDLRALLVARPRLASVAVLYGAGHMRDLEARLAALGFRAVRTRWLRAITVAR